MMQAQISKTETSQEEKPDPEAQQSLPSGTLFSEDLRREFRKLPFSIVLAVIAALLYGYFEGIDFEFTPFTFLSLLLLLPSHVGVRIVYEQFIKDLHPDEATCRCGDPVVQAVVNGLRHRARRVRNTSGFVLMLIAVVLYLGFSTFTTAERSAREVTSDRDRSRLEELLKSERSALERDQDRIEFLSRSLRQESVPPEIATRINKDIESLEKDIDRRNANIDKIFTRLSDPQPHAQNNDADNAAKFALSLLSTKIGAVLLLVFGAQILVMLYRYNIRLGAFSDSRADMLQLADAKTLETRYGLATLLSPDALEFGKPPSSPSKHAVELAKEILSSIKSGKGLLA
jgi:hypothetical protein